MLITYYGIVIFHLIEWIKYIKKVAHVLISNEVGYNAMKQRHDVRS
jgi:hypothetical protein